jgi:serine protease Do
MCFFVFTGTLGAVGEKKGLEAREIDGEVYVKASSLEQQLGGSGTYNEITGTYVYQPVNLVTEAAKKTSPSVVGIIGKPKDDTTNSPSRDDRFNLVHGTGVIVKDNGWIITNAHVVKDLKQIVVVTADGKQYTGRSPYLDEESDLALVKITASNLPVATLAEHAELEVGETVVAIGTPISFALRNSVTVGVVSGIDRSIHSTYRLLQTDAAINPGNSGGALVNLKGEVIGINSLKFAAAGIDNLGFAIPIDTVHYVMNQLFTYGKVMRASLGLDLEESWAAIVGLPTEEPLTIKGVHSDTAAAKSGLKSGDVLYSVNHQNLTTLVDLNEWMKQFKPGDEVEIAVQSNGDLRIIKLTLGEDHKK